MSIKDAVKLIEESEARFVDLRFTDTKGKQHHFTVPRPHRPRRPRRVV